jgi:hypothetical protein
VVSFSQWSKFFGKKRKKFTLEVLPEPLQCSHAKQIPMLAMRSKKTPAFPTFAIGSAD